MVKSKASASSTRAKESLFIALSFFSMIMILSLLIYILMDNVNSSNPEIPTGQVIIDKGSSCVDSDDGKDYFTYGTITSIAGISGIISDSCIGSLSTSTSLTEYYCDSSGQGNSEIVDCGEIENSGVCQFGKCLFCNNNGSCERDLKESEIGCPTDCVLS